MANVTLDNRDVTSLDPGLALVASTAPSTSSATTAQYGGYPSINLLLGGSGFTYDAQGRLAGGTITSASSYTVPLTSGIGQNAGTSVTVDATSLPVTTLLALLAKGQSTVPALLAGSNTYTTRTSDVTGSDGDDVFNIAGPRYNYSFGNFQGEPAVDRSRVSIAAGGGQNTAVFAPLRSQVSIVGGGGNETVSAPTLDVTAHLQMVDKLQFLDGAVYETNGSFGAQAALMFEGVFGRLPDAINAGGFALVAEQSGREAAAARMLATPEGAADTTGLSNARFVTRLYEDMLHREPDAAGFAGWQADLDSGQLGRADVTARFAGGIEAQAANLTAFATGAVFAANPNAVEVVRAYETLLARPPEGVALVGDINRLDAGLSLRDFYTAVQHSTEFASHPSNPYGITAATPYASVYAISHSDSVTEIVGPLVTSQWVGHG